MKKKIITGVVLLALILAAIFAINYYRQNNINREDFLLPGNYLSQGRDNQGVFDATLYFTESGDLKAIDSEGQSKFDVKLDQGFKKILYGKNIYISYDKKIQALNRLNGKLIKEVEFEKEILNIELIDNQVYAYIEDGYVFLGERLNKFDLYTYDGQPTAMSQQGSKRAVNLLESIRGNINSRIVITDSDREVFNINSAEEIFLYNRVLSNGKVFLVSNRYIYLIKESSIENKVFIKNPKAIDFKDDQIQVLDFDSLRRFDSNLDEIDSVTIEDDIEQIKILDTSTVAYSASKIYVYQNGNVMNTDIQANHKIYQDQYGVYLFTNDRVERVKAY